MLPVGLACGYLKKSSSIIFTSVYTYLDAEIFDETNLFQIRNNSIEIKQIYVKCNHSVAMAYF